MLVPFPLKAKKEGSLLHQPGGRLCASHRFTVMQSVTSNRQPARAVLGQPVVHSSSQPMLVWNQTLRMQTLCGFSNLCNTGYKLTNSHRTVPIQPCMVSSFLIEQSVERTRDASVFDTQCRFRTQTACFSLAKNKSIYAYHSITRVMPPIPHTLLHRITKVAVSNNYFSVIGSSSSWIGSCVGLDI